MSGLVSLDSLRRFTREDSAGIFDDEYQVELFDGYVVTSAAPVGGAHGWAVSNLAKLFVQSVDSPDLRIHLHGGISLSEYGVLQPTSLSSGEYRSGIARIQPPIRSYS